MSLVVIFSFAVFLIAVFFLLLSLIMVYRKYAIKTVLISLFFLIITVEYGIFIFFEFQGTGVNLMLFASSDLLMLLLLIILMITR
ncbi:MAG: hypothetical protein QXN66_01575 [Thermoplasmatales archaeon]